MKIKWLGHSCFVITSDKGVRVMTDTFKKDANLSYPRPAEKVDAVTASHDHFDHLDPDFIASLPGKPEVIKDSKARTIGDVSIKGVDVWHDESGGKERGPNIIFCMNVDGINVCHLGDLGHQLTAAQISALGKVDVLLIPVGGVFTIDVQGATMLCLDVNPKIVIPMHYRTDRCKWLTWTADDFAKGKKNVKKTGSSEVELNASRLPTEMQVILLEYAA